MEDQEQSHHWQWVTHPCSQGRAQSPRRRKEEVSSSWRIFWSWRKKMKWSCVECCNKGRWIEYVENKKKKENSQIKWENKRNWWKKTLKYKKKKIKTTIVMKEQNQSSLLESMEPASTCHMRNTSDTCRFWMLPSHGLVLFDCEKIYQSKKEWTPFNEPLWNQNIACWNSIWCGN